MRVTVTWAVVLLGSLLLLVWGFPFYDWTTDDSFITYRFSENLAGGEGLAFNPGEPVEGFSNFLWMLGLAAGAFLGLDPVVVSKVGGGLSLVGILVVADRIIQTAKVSLIHRILLAVVIACDTSIVIYTLAGLETVFYGFLIFLYTWLSVTHIVDGRERLGAILVVSFLILMTRPEGVLYGVVFILWYTSAVFKARAKKGSLLRAVPGAHGRWLLAFAAGIVALTAFRYLYFGDFLPNTFYAKPSGSFGREFPTGGIAYLDEAVKDLGYVWPLLLLLYFLDVKPKELAAYRFAIARSIAPLMVFSVYAGGDWMPNSRFLVPVFPLIYILGITILSDVAKYFRGRRWGWLASALGILAVSIAIVHQLTARYTIYEGRDRIPYDLMNAGNNAKPLGLWLRENFHSSCVVATKRIGVVPYYSGLPTLDLYGLIDKEIARLIYRGGSFQEETVAMQISDTVLERSPSLIILHSENGNTFSPHGVQEEFLLKGMGDQYQVIGDYAFSETFTNRVFLRKGVVSPETFWKLQEDFPRDFRKDRETVRMKAHEELPHARSYQVVCEGHPPWEP